jgi:hypothetical protein
MARSNSRLEKGAWNLAIFHFLLHGTGRNQNKQVNWYYQYGIAMVTGGAVSKLDTQHDRQQACATGQKL